MSLIMNATFGVWFTTIISVAVVASGMPPPEDYDDYGSVPPSGGISGYVIWGIIAVVVLVVWLKTKD